jgi:hypothetical protein
MRRLLLGWLLAWLASGAAPAQSPEEMTYVFNAPESSLDVRYEYHWEILRTALEKTRGKWGPYRMTGSERMTEKRQAHELMNATGKLSVMYLGTMPDFEKNLYGIHIPVDRNLGGLLRLPDPQGTPGRFPRRRLDRGSQRVFLRPGLGWIDVDILRRSNSEGRHRFELRRPLRDAAPPAVRRLPARRGRGARRAGAAEGHDARPLHRGDP